MGNLLPKEGEAPKYSLKLISEEDYLKSDKTIKMERERNLLLLMKFRPSFFTPEEQTRFEEINYQIKKTSIWILAGFLANSGFRFWQIKTQNKNVTFAVTFILAAYLPAFSYY